MESIILKDFTKGVFTPRKSNPKLSLIVPVYNSDLYLHRCIDSILNQSFKDYELILIDDGSIDLSGIICDEYAEQNENIKVIHQINKGVSAARNVGLKNAKGEWVAFIDSDDELVDGGLNLLIGKTSNDVDLVICGYTVHDTMGSIVYEYNHYYEKKLDYIEGLKEMYVPSNHRYQGYLWNKLYRNEVIVRNNLEFNEDIYFNEDRLFITQYICCMNNMHKIIQQHLYINTMNMRIVQWIH